MTSSPFAPTQVVKDLLLCSITMLTVIKGFKVTKQSMLRQSPSWQAVSANIHPGARNFMSNQQCLGDQLAQLGRDASAAGLLVVLQHRRRVLWRSNRLVGVAAKTESRVKKYFRLEFMAKEQEHTDEDLDIKALEDGFVSVTPLSLLPKLDSDTQATQILVSNCVKRHLNL